jgi:2-(1,2-epoxy-1,2-dihydrophenyl)acetyl-CoA isomerase
VSVVTLERPEPDVAVLTLDRPEVRNAIGSQTWPLVIEHLSTLRDAEIRALIVTGRGNFCSGGDLRDPGLENSGVLAGGVPGRLGLAHQVFELLERAPYPVIAAVEGGAIGIGWSLALACDLVVAAEDALFAAPFLARGLTPDGALWWRLVRALGPQAAGEILYCDRRLSGVDARSLGLVTHIAATGAALDRALEVARGFADLPADTFAVTKRMIRSAAGLSLTDAYQVEVMASALNIAGGAPEEGRQAYREKRPPRFRRRAAPAADLSP